MYLLDALLALHDGDVHRQAVARDNVKYRRGCVTTAVQRVAYGVGRARGNHSDANARALAPPPPQQPAPPQKRQQTTSTRSGPQLSGLQVR
eukprot:scaffold2176_cov350-Prasinococcus_capsulatus_cf.AAC.2